MRECTLNNYIVIVNTNAISNVIKTYVRHTLLLKSKNQVTSGAKATLVAK